MSRLTGFAAAMLVAGVTSLAMAGLPTTATLAWHIEKGCDIALLPLENAPYPHPSRANGWTYKELTFPADKHYSDPTVGFVIPPGFRPSKSVDLIVHFHGHRNYVSRVLEDFDLPEQLAAAGKNAILLCPQGPRDSVDSGCGKLEDPDGLKRFVEEALSALAACGKIPPDAHIGNLVLSGHSGGYKVIGYCLRHGGMEDHIRAVWLWDATYGMLEDYAAWLGRTRWTPDQIAARLPTPQETPPPGSSPTAIPLQPIGENRPGKNTQSRTADSAADRTVLSVFTAHLAEDNATLMALLQRLEIPFGIWFDTDFAVAIRSDKQARFVTTTLEHNDVVHKNRFFQEAVSTAPFLDAIP